MAHLIRFLSKTQAATWDKFAQMPQPYWETGDAPIELAIDWFDPEPSIFEIYSNNFCELLREFAKKIRDVHYLLFDKSVIAESEILNTYYKQTDCDFQCLFVRENHFVIDKFTIGKMHIISSGILEAIKRNEAFSNFIHQKLIVKLHKNDIAPEDIILQSLPPNITLDTFKGRN